MKRNVRFFGITLILSLMLLSGCGAGKNETTAATSAEPVSSASETTAETTKPAPTEETTQAETTTEEETVPPTTEETRPVISFTDTDTVLFSTDRVNVRSLPGSDGEILSVLAYGEAVEVTGISEEWLRIRYNGKEAYVFRSFFAETEPIADTLAGRVDQLVPRMAVAKETDQLVLCVGKNDGGDRCTVFYYTKDAIGRWVCEFFVEGFWGYNGVNKVIYEADGRTPVGCFPFRFAYGIAPDPGSIMEYKQATAYSYVPDDPNSKYYNQWVETSDPSIVPDWASAEHIIDYTISYQYGLFIENNPDCNPYEGSSVICLHCETARGISPGCVNIPQENVIRLVTTLRETSRIVIVYGVEDLLEY